MNLVDTSKYETIEELFEDAKKNGSTMVAFHGNAVKCDMLDFAFITLIAIISLMCSDKEQKALQKGVIDMINLDRKNRNLQ